MSEGEALDGLGLVFAVIEYNKRPEVLWSGSTWHAEISSWDLLIKILAAKNNLEDIGWNFLPLIWESRHADHEEEIFALTKFFMIPGIGSAYLVVYHQLAEVLTQFLLLEEENIAYTFEGLLSSHLTTQRLSNEQLKQIRITCQHYYEILSCIQT
ncbi:MAG: hypothetical protein ACW98F_11005 [Candidatus Hodarchaeales archaeon]|jgi:hypothetical protein